MPAFQLSIKYKKKENKPNLIFHYFSDYNI